MSVIVISKGSFLGGELLAESLAKKLGYRCIDREVIVEKAAVAGVEPQRLRETLLEPPSLFDRLIAYHKYVYLSMLQAALANQVKEGRVVYHGYVGHLLLSDASPIFRIRIIASVDLRLKLAQERLGMTRKAAATHIRKMDQQRKKWTYALYGVDWEDPSLYDMVFNLGRLLNVEEASTIIASMVREHSCFDFTPEHQVALREFALASDVRACLAMEIPAAKVKDIKAKGDVVSIWMTSDDLEHVDDVRQVARTVPGVARIDVKY